MELQEKYKDGRTTITVKGMKVKVVDDPKQFDLYKNLGLDVFKKVKKQKKDVATPDDGASE